MNGFANEFLNMKLEGCDDGLIVKGLVFGTKAYGIGSCIVVVEDNISMFHQICLEDVLYVPNLLHHHPRIFSVISACSQNECQCNFQLNSYSLNIKFAKIDFRLSKGLLWIQTVDHSTIPHFVSVIFKIRIAFSSTLFLVDNGTDNTTSIPGGCVYDKENHIECGTVDCVLCSHSWDYVLKGKISWYFVADSQIILIMQIQFVIIPIKENFGWRNSTK